MENTKTAIATVTPAGEATNVYFTCDDDPKTTVSPAKATASPQTITVMASSGSSGHTAVQARCKSATGKVLATLNICTYGRAEYTVDFYCISDNAGHATTRTTGAADGFITSLNDIYKPQSIYCWAKGTSETKTVQKDLGTEVTNTEWNDVVAVGDQDSPNVFFVWEYEDDADPKTDSADAVCSAGNILYEDNISGDEGRGMGHEMGHFLGIAGDYKNAAGKNELMYGYSDGGKKLLHAQVCPNGAP